ncbi:MAG: hypothetical protein WEA58_04030 [Balneolaceae bacterium]
MGSLVQHRNPNMLGNNPDKGAVQQFFELKIKYAKVINRQPATGIPSTLQVEVQTQRNLGYSMRFPISSVSCPEVLVVAREYNVENPQILGYAPLTTNFGFFLDDCKGTADMRINNFKPSRTDLIVLDVYETQGIDRALRDDIIPIYTSQPIDLGLDLDTGRDTGNFAKGSQNYLTAGVFNLGEQMNTVVKVGTAGLIGYFLFANRDTINQAVKNVVPNTKKASK